MNIEFKMSVPDQESKGSWGNGNATIIIAIVAILVIALFGFMYALEHAGSKPNTVIERHFSLTAHGSEKLTP